MKIEIIDPDGAAIPEAIGQAVCRAMRWDTDENQAIIYVNPRLENGWLEYQLSIQTKECKGIIFIGMVQRQPNTEFEFHS